MGILFGDFSGIPKTERRKRFLSSVLSDVFAWGVSLGIIAAILGIIYVIVFFFFQIGDMSYAIEDFGGVTPTIMYAIIALVLGALTSGVSGLILGALFGAVSGAIDAWIGGLIGISGGRGVGLGFISGLIGLVNSLITVFFIYFMFRISGGTGADILEVFGLATEGDDTWAIYLAAVLMIIVVVMVHSLIGLLLGAVGGAVVGIFNVFLKGKWRVFSEVLPATFYFGIVGILIGVQISNMEVIYPILIGLLCGVILGAGCGLMIGVLRYVVPDRFLKRSRRIVGSNETG